MPLVVNGRGLGSPDLILDENSQLIRQIQLNGDSTQWSFL